jgi:hypothetical protein
VQHTRASLLSGAAVAGAAVVLFAIREAYHKKN